MPKARTSMEARIVEWFQSAPLEVAESVLGIVQGILRSRRPPVAKTIKTKSRRTTQKTNAQPQVAEASSTGVQG